MQKFMFAMVAILVLAMAAVAVPPPANGNYQAGWGMNPTNWEATSGSFEATGIWVPGQNWAVDYDEAGNPIYIEYAPITLELWVELYATQSYEFTSYQWHRLGDAEETITFTINGTVISNNEEWVGLTRGEEDLDHLYFRHDIFGRTGSNYGSDLPITWEGAWGTGLEHGVSVVQDWMTLNPNNAGNLYMHINEPCDHWFQFRGNFTLPYHVDDGYYSLTIAGCPAPEL